MASIGWTQLMSRRAASAALSAALLLSSLVAGSGQAFVPNGYKWPDPGNLTYWNYSSGNDYTAWQSAFGDWNATPTPVVMTKNSVRGNEDIGGYSVTNSGVKWDGLTIYTHSGTTFVYAESQLNDFFTDGYVANKRRSVTGHEIGHALGLGHQSGQDLMNPATCGAASRYCAWGIYTPRSDDINGINTIY
jgi:hypothetical protein